MCGIAGMLATDGPVGRLAGDLDGAARRMLDSIAHRGPDAEGVWADDRCLLAHKRLSIIDLDHGHQPMVNEDGRVAVAFNGCIYNYQDIARELRTLGHHFDTHSDTEVVLRAYLQWGPACVQRFNGMWGIVIRDGRDGTTFFSRDRLGIKPMYIAQVDGGVVFASEVKAILASGLFKGRTDTDGLRQYLTFQLTLGERTMFAGVRRLEPGTNLVIDREGRATTERYWDIAFGINHERTEDEWMDRLRFLLEDAVRLRMVSDVPLGSHLSGGLDSSALVGLARLALGDDAEIKTFTGAFGEGQAFDETRYAKEVAAQQKATYLETYLDERAFIDSIERIAWHMDYPEAGPGVFPQYWVSRLAADHVKVVLGGQGGDETFVGYARYLVAHLEACLRGSIRPGADRDSHANALRSLVGQLPTLEAYEPMMRGFFADGLFDEPAARYFRLMDRSAGSRRLFSADVAPDIETTFGEFEAIFNRHSDADAINRILYTDAKTHLPALLHVEDRTSMAWGLESRVPLLDYRIIELMASCPVSIKFREGRTKHLYRGAVRSMVPKSILERTDKMGFPVPLNQWMKGALGQYVRDVLLSSTAKARGLFQPEQIEAALENQGTFSRGIWGALCVELWHRRFIDQSASTKPAKISSVVAAS
ncbi:MAG: asparagine synthase (glutamine-hydrolyzing) [Planctomycetota bacterium]